MFTKKFNAAEQNVKDRIEALCSESKLSIDEVTYFFTTILRLFVKIFQASF